MFIATAVRLLADEGKLDLDAPLSRYLIACYRDADGVIHELEPVDG